MVKMDISKEEIKQLLALMKKASVPIANAEAALVLYKKFLEAEKE